MKLSDLIEQLEDLRDEHGGDAEVLGAYQPAYPLAGRIIGACVLDANDDTQPVVWIAIGEHPYDSSPYAPRAAFEEARR